jgi:hypothetical protein
MVQSAASAGPNFQDAADWFAQRVCEVRATSVERDRIALDLGRPTLHIAEQINGKRLAIIKRIELCKFLTVLLEKIGEAVMLVTP